VKATNIPERQAEQVRVLDLGASLTKPGGTLVYVTCSVLPEENRDQVEAFVERHGDFMVEPFTTAWTERVGGEPPSSADGRDDTLQLTPAQHGTDGFFIALMRRHKP
jgi:16S rRNA (cytosine967-C5)-methyltransferase